MANTVSPMWFKRIVGEGGCFKWRSSLKCGSELVFACKMLCVLDNLLFSFKRYCGWEFDCLVLKRKCSIDMVFSLSTYGFRLFKTSLLYFLVFRKSNRMIRIYPNLEPGLDICTYYDDLFIFVEKEQTFKATRLR